MEPDERVQARGLGDAEGAEDRYRADDGVCASSVAACAWGTTASDRSLRHRALSRLSVSAASSRLSIGDIESSSGVNGLQAGRAEEAWHATSGDPSFPFGSGGDAERRDCTDCPDAPAAASRPPPSWNMVALSSSSSPLECQLALCPVHQTARAVPRRRVEISGITTTAVRSHAPPGTPAARPQAGPLWAVPARPAAAARAANRAF